MKRLTSREVLLLLIIVVSTMLRVVLWKEFPLGPFDNDARRFAARAAEIDAGRDFGGAHPTAWEPPGYPYLMALLGGYRRGHLDWLISTQILCSALTTCFVAGVARRLLPPRAAVVATALVAFSPNNLSMDIIPMTESLSTVMWCGVSIGVLLLLERHAGGWRSRLGFVVAGLLLGLTALVRPTFFYLPWFLLAVLAVLACRPWCGAGRMEAARRWLRATEWVVLGMMLAVAPWTIRNAVKLHSFIVISSNGSEVVWCTNNPIGYLTRLDEFPGKGLPELERGALARKLAWEYIRQDPVAAVLRIGPRLQHLVGTFPYAPVALSCQAPTFARSPLRQIFDQLSLALWCYWVGGCVLLVVLGRWMPRGDAFWFLVGCLLYWVTFHGLIWSQERLRHPMEPALLMLGTMGWWGLLVIAGGRFPQFGWTPGAVDRQIAG